MINDLFPNKYPDATNTDIILVFKVQDYEPTDMLSSDCTNIGVSPIKKEDDVDTSYDWIDIQLSNENIVDLITVQNNAVLQQNYS